MTATDQPLVPGLRRGVETKPYGVAFTAFGLTHTDTLCVTNDLTASCEADEFRARYPERYFSLGMAEQNLAGVLAGMANDDIGLMSQLPNMTVLEVGDATEARTVLEVMDSIDGPVFCRMLRGEVPVLFDSPMQFNTARELSAGSDVLVLSSGVHTEIVAGILSQFHDAGVEVGHLHVSTLKPFTDPLVLDRLSHASRVITVENHLVRGGLGTTVAELNAEHGLGTRLRRVGIQDTFTHGGTRDYLFDYYQIGESAIIDAVEDAVGRRVLDRSSVTAGERAQHHNAAVAEGL